jgi:predicted aconitase with swiveling domain
MLIRGRVLNPGSVSGPVIVLEEPLSFWGGFDPRTGAIIDVHHPQRGTRLAGSIVLMSEARGSGTAPGAIAEAIRLQTAPAAILLIEPDVNIAIGAAVARALYGRACAVLVLDRESYAALTRASAATVTEDGLVTAAYQ